MNEFWQGFWTGVCAYIIFAWLLNRIMIKILAGIVVNQIKKEQLGVTKEEVLLTLEKHGDMLYCYRKDNNEFVGQAKTVEEIGNIFTKRFPQYTGRILKEDSAGLL